MDPYSAAALVILSIIEHAAAGFRKIRDDAQQNAAWTPEQAEQWEAKMDAALAGDQWKTDEEIG